jgi:predicted lactoylglutathione lyase
MAFFSSLGFGFEAKYTNEMAACMIVGEDSFVMLLTAATFQGFAPNPICDGFTSTEALTSLSCSSRSEVDALILAAKEAGGSTYAEPKDYGSMYSHSFQDLDGHTWEFFYMAPEVDPKPKQNAKNGHY